MKSFSFFIVFAFLWLVMSGSVSAITLQDLLNQPLPDPGVFVVNVWNFLTWLWDRIVYYSNIILSWTLDTALAYIWQILVWMWNTLVSSIVAGWFSLLYIWELLVDNSFIDFSSLPWPWL